MLTRLASLLKRVRRNRDLQLSDANRITKWGHRRYVGGPDPESWYGIGKRQYHFLVSEGLEAGHVLLDIACGSLRLGQFAIPMLDAGNYYGLELEQELVDAGLSEELLFNLPSQKDPRFSFNSEFDFSFCDGFDYAIAQSLFTHLTMEDIHDCYRNLRKIALPTSKFYATFLEGEASRNPEGQSHPNRDWYYDFATIREAADRAGWSLSYIGDWGHERGQVMTCAQIRIAESKG